MQSIILARVKYAECHHRGDYILRHLEETPALNYMGRWFSTLDILDYCLYNEYIYPEHLLLPLPIDQQAAKGYFDFVRSYHEQSVSQ